MQAPIYSVGDTVYLLESAQLGFLEGYAVSNITASLDGSAWLYGIAIGTRQQVVATSGDRITHQHPGNLYFSEEELITYCAALQIIKGVLSNSLAKIDTLLASCP